MKKSDLSKLKKIISKNSSGAKSLTSWEPVARWYDELLAGKDTYQSQVILPNLLRLVSPKNRRIIDIACGQGFFSKIFAENGARVLGLDISKELISLAKKSQISQSENENPEICPRFDVASADNLKPAQNDSFDVATIILALQNIKELNGTLKEAGRVLVKNGTLVIVLNHPCFRILKASAWGYDEKNNLQYRRIDKYGRPFSVDVDMTPGAKISDSKNKIFTKSFHRPIQDYFKALAGAGFIVTGLEEWISHKQSDAGPRASAEDTARKEFPMFLTIIARKQGTVLD